MKKAFYLCGVLTSFFSVAQASENQVQGIISQPHLEGKLSEIRDGIMELKNRNSGGADSFKDWVLNLAKDMMRDSILDSTKPGEEKIVKALFGENQNLFKEAKKILENHFEDWKKTQEKINELTKKSSMQQDNAYQAYLTKQIALLGRKEGIENIWEASEEKIKNCNFSFIEESYLCFLCKYYTALSVIETKRREKTITLEFPEERVSKLEKDLDETKDFYEEALKLENLQSSKCTDFAKKIASKLAELKSVKTKEEYKTFDLLKINDKTLMKEQLEIISSHPNFHVKKIEVEIQTQEENHTGETE